MKPSKIVVDQLVHDLQYRPDDFRCGDIVLEDTRTKYQYWVANGFSCAGIHRPYEMSFGFIQGWRFHQALNKWKAERVVTASGAL